MGGGGGGGGKGHVGPPPKLLGVGCPPPPPPTLPTPVLYALSFLTYKGIVLFNLAFGITSFFCSDDFFYKM